jgi:hypothetical protein
MKSMLASLALITLAAAVPAEEIDAEALTFFDILDLVSGQTAECRKEKDQSLCSNLFTEDGVIKQSMHDDGELKQGRWFIDDQNRLCILWDGKIKPLCFLVYEQDDGSYNLIKRGKHITTILGVESGNPNNL